MLIIWVQEENDIEGSVSYSRFRIDAIPARQGRMVGNTLRRTLLRQDEHREPDWWDQLFFWGLGIYPGGPCGTTLTCAHMAGPLQKLCSSGLSLATSLLSG